jgi:ATP-dependent DNA helicase PIF1
VAVTASTGIAAVNIGGTTVHRFAGLGVSGNKRAQISRAQRFARNNWETCDILIIDEVVYV